MIASLALLTLLSSAPERSVLELRAMAAIGSPVGRGDVGLYQVVSLELEYAVNPYFTAGGGLTFGPSMFYDDAGPGGTASARVFPMGKAPGGFYVGVSGFWWGFAGFERVIFSHTYHVMGGYRFILGRHFALSVEAFVGPAFESTTGFNGGGTLGIGAAF